MPYPTAVVADALTYKNSAGVAVPALAASADGGDGLISLFVDDPAGAYFVHVVPKDLTGARYNSWNWPTGSSAHTDVTLTAVGSTPNANGASLSGQALTLQPADGTYPGVVSATTQTFVGDKTLTGTTTVTGLRPVDDGGQVLGATNRSWAWAYIAALRDGGDVVRVSAPGSLGNAYKGNVPDGATAVAHTLDNAAALSDAASKLVSIKNNAVEKAFIGPDGTVELPVVGASLILKSPDGTRWKLVVADTTGALTTTAA